MNCLIDEVRYRAKDKRKNDQKKLSVILNQVLKESRYYTIGGLRELNASSISILNLLLFALPFYRTEYFLKNC